MDTLIDEWNRILQLNEIADRPREESKPPPVVGNDIERLCMHCCHPWVGEKLEYPFSQDRSGKFRTGGQFCSWECIKGYSHDVVSRAVSGVHHVNIRYYRKMMTGLTDNVVTAPPRIALKAFGGHLTIEEFRKGDKSVEYAMNYDAKITITPYTMYDYNSVDKNVTTVQIETPLSIPSTGIKNEHLRLRRTKPLAQGRTNIERSLGLNTFANFIKSS